MLLGFQRRFAPYVRDGSKRHTIRARGKRRRFRPGDRCDCYVDSRQKTMKLLGRWPCLKVQEIKIAHGSEHPLRVWIDGEELRPDEVEALFRRDGFRSDPAVEVGATVEALGFWRKRLAAGPWVGDLIHWERHN